MIQQLDSEEIVTELDISHLVIEDDTPVDNFQSAKQQRCLVEPLYASWVSGTPFIADSNIGLFYGINQEPIVPDAFLSLNVTMPADWSQKKNRSYFVWEFGKVPEVCIEIVSNRKGSELASKKSDYARIGIPYYVVFDPLQQLQRPDELNGKLLQVWVLTAGEYLEMPEPCWLQTVGLGLTVWEGVFEGQEGIWLRWCDRDGQVIPTGAERADGAEAKAQRLAERLREMGINPDEI
jgi:Uma2 family endonuclease